MRKWFLLVCLLVILGWPVRAGAQAEPSISLLEIDLWPEFDRPTVLVIYRLTLGAEASLPVDLAIKIPSNAGAPTNPGEPYAVAAKQLDGTLINLAYEIQPGGDWIAVKFTATMPDVQLEYYDPDLVKQDSRRHFEYVWPGGYQINALILQVKQPVDSSNMIISPGLGFPVTGSEGLTYYSAQVGSLGPDQTYALTLDYQKSNDKLTAESIQIQPSEPLGPNTPGRKTFSNVLSSLGLTGGVAIILGGLGVALIVGAGIWYFASSRKGLPLKPRRRLRGRREEGEVIEAQAAPAGSTVYCHQCGNRAQPGDVFCRTCGTRLRAE